MGDRSSRTVAALQARIHQIEGLGHCAGASQPLQGRANRVRPFGIGGLDAALPGGGLPYACVHEVASGSQDGRVDPGAALGFGAALLAGLSGGTPTAASRPALWIAPDEGPYMPGLAAFGLPPGRLLVASWLRKSADRLWALEEALRSGALCAVIAQLDGADFTASRRLQLAAEEGGITGIVLTSGRGSRSGKTGRFGGTRSSGGIGRAGLATAVTRWCVASVPSAPAPVRAGPGGVGAPRWDVHLAHSRGGRPGRWQLQWQAGQWQVLSGAEQGQDILPPAANDAVSLPLFHAAG